jgi:signal transduction histidine kinase
VRAALGPFREAQTYRALGFLLSALPLGVLWLTVLLTSWTLAVAAAITPLVVPVVIGIGLAFRGSAAVEAALSRALLQVDVSLPYPPAAGHGFWTRAWGVVSDPWVWRAQAYLGLRLTLGLGVAVGLLTLIGAGLIMLASPTFYWAAPHGVDLAFLRIDTFPESLALVPAGALALIASAHLVGPLAAPWRTLSTTLLGEASVTDQGRADTRASRRRAVAARAIVVAGANLALIVVWALTSRGYFWPVWTLLALGVPLAIHAWVAWVREHPTSWIERRLSPGFGIHVGVWAVLLAFLISIWAITSQGYFWPIWPALPALVAVGVHAAVLLVRSPDHAALTERISTLESTRAGAVDVQEAELRRIERDLHDGAQARLVALGMSIGMAEQKLATDADAARALLAEARVGAGEALRELRDLARGIHPPVLADRGLEAAVHALAASSPIPVAVSVENPDRAKPPVESAAYFVVAEALANAGKHAGASRVTVRIARTGNILTAEVEDDGAGGADASGSGLSGLRRRVEALDGTLTVASPAGGPTTIRAELPCE